jgi:hypothetical protein
MATLTADNPAAQAQNSNVVFALPRPDSGPKAYRLDIDEFLADNAMTNLFLLALSEMQKNSIKYAKSDKLNWWSFYSIAGMMTSIPRSLSCLAIHGLPKEDWAGSGYPNQETFGYCHHGMNTFPSRHHPYMFQMEVGEGGHASVETLLAYIFLNSKPSTIR